MKKIIQCVFALCLAISIGVILVTPQPAHAESKNLMELFFGGKQQQPTRTYQQPSTAPAPIRINPPIRIAPPKPEKSADARRILVIGDFMAAALAEGLNQAYANNPMAVIVNQSNASSGLVRSDHYNWPKEILNLTKDKKADIIVVMIGANDNQIFPNLSTAEIGSEVWMKEYQRRVKHFIQAIQQTGKPFIIVGAPAFKASDLTQMLVSFNTIYKQEGESYGGEFIDIWEGFVDTNGAFSSSGFDTNGNTVRLRANDGVGFTAAGKRKLAFYLEKSLQQLLDSNAPRLTLSHKTGASIGTLSSDSKKIAPMGLWDMAKQNSGLIEKIPTEADEQTTYNTPQPGRADFFNISVQ